jgi:hypothetical protein
MERKVCSKCNLEKDLSEYLKRSDRAGRHYSYCKACNRAKIKQHYRENKPKYIAKAAKRNKEYLKGTHSFLLSYFNEHPCVDCGEKDPVVLQFDHVNGKKFMAVSRMICFKFSLEKIKQEIAKCAVRCAHCHIRKTAKQFNWFWIKFGPIV